MSDWFTGYGQQPISFLGSAPAAFDSTGPLMASSSGLFGNAYNQAQLSGTGGFNFTPTPTQGWASSLGSWMSNGQNLGTVMNGIGTLAQAYLGFRQLSQAKDQLKLSKEAFNANLNNSIASYNTSLEDRIRGRTSDYAGKENDVQAYLAKHSLKR